jgi:hypothetical protein
MILLPIIFIALAAAFSANEPVPSYKTTEQLYKEGRNERR